MKESLTVSVEVLRVAAGGQVGWVKGFCLSHRSLSPHLKKFQITLLIIMEI